MECVEAVLGLVMCLGVRNSGWTGVDEDCDVYVDEGSSSAGCYTGGELVISEIQYWPLSNSSYEWFEIYNPTSTAITMETMKITRENTGTGGNQSFYVGDTIVVDAAGFVVFCFSSTPLGSTCDYVYGSSTTGISSNLGAAYNSSFSLTQTSATTIVIDARSAGAYLTLDEVNYVGASPYASWPSSAQGKSIELDESLLDSTSNDVGSNWCETQETSHYYNVSTNRDYGTPNAANICP